MVLDFSCVAETATLIDPEFNKTLFMTHGHLWGPGLHNSVDRWPPLNPGDVFYTVTRIKSEPNTSRASLHYGV